MNTAIKKNEQQDSSRQTPDLKVEQTAFDQNNSLQPESNHEALLESRNSTVAYGETSSTASSESTPEHVPTKESEVNGVEQNQPIQHTEDSRKRFKIPSRKHVILPVPQKKDELTVQIEHIMEEGLKDAFKELTPVQQQEFKLKGEETAGKIRQLLFKTHIKVKKIFQLLFEWLQLLPGVSRFFLQQEAKIKADKILHLKHRHDRKYD